MKPHAAAISCALVLSVLVLAGCMDEADGEDSIDPDHDPLPCDDGVAEQPACIVDVGRTFAVADCISTESILRIPAENSQLPGDWEPFLFQGLAQLSVVDYRCPEWVADDAALGAASLTLVGEYVRSPDGDDRAGAPQVYTYVVLSNQEALAQRMANSFHEIESAVYEYPDRPTDPHTFSFSGGGLDYSATVTLQRYTSTFETVRSYYQGPPSEGAWLIIDGRERSANAPVHVVQASGGVFDDALPSPAWVSNTSPWILESGLLTLAPPASQ